MRGSRLLLAALLAMTACGGDEADPALSAAPETTAATAAATTPAPTQRDVEHTLRDAAIAIETYFSDEGTYAGATTAKLVEQGHTPEPGVTVDVVSATKTAYCLSAAGGGVTLYFSSAVGKVSRTACS